LSDNFDILLIKLGLMNYNIAPFIVKVRQ